MEKTSKYSAEIKTEVLEICETFGLGSFQELLTIDETKVSQGYIFVQFDTNMGRYNHYYNVKNQHEGNYILEINKNIGIEPDFKLNPVQWVDWNMKTFGNSFIDAAILWQRKEIKRIQALLKKYQTKE